ncbi:MAG TPA: metal-sensitive transcriptional regulator [Fimbriimonadaceae bacterium]|jgi:DNA-binding FrmR family transcriptional regulator
MTAALKTGANKRLARIAGQVTGLQKMVAEERACADLLQQIVALRGALDQLGVICLTEHLQSCVLHQGISGEDHCCADLPESARSEEIRNSLTRFLK